MANLTPYTNMNTLTPDDVNTDADHSFDKRITDLEEAIENLEASESESESEGE